MNATAEQMKAAQQIAVERLERNRAIAIHNERMQRLRVNGNAYRDRLVAARINNRKDQ